MAQVNCPSPGPEPLVFLEAVLSHSPYTVTLGGNPVASVIGGPVSGVIPDHTHWFGLSSWRWLLILEGITAIHEPSLFPSTWVPLRLAA
jgi:hypothetical protein